ncbi:ornithine cyclodeaminase [Paraburkholderia aspalathi]|uniref:Alanine dehydrogenase n=1 Tax=Paraburkholderia aspalathi TaxID=1324617 RepID=A0A1I7AAW7_9BURK|nr:ornithine cyclodeaminase [Paraburkholderia aspalathi]SFT72058.1 alanine dehydrogenase [Paraburkholderia aspalathi]
MGDTCMMADTCPDDWAFPDYIPGTSAGRLQRTRLAPAFNVTTLKAAVVGRLVRDALRAVRDGVAYGTKAVLQPAAHEFRALVPDASAGYGVNERANWKLSTLLGINARYGAVKVVGSHSYNLHLGLPRSTSTLILYDKLTMRIVEIMDGTMLSTQRTGAYASLVVDCLLRRHEVFDVFLFGTGRVAEAIADDLQAHHAGRVRMLHVKSRSPASAEKFARETGRRVDFPVRAARDLAMMPACALVITASNTITPLFPAQQVGPHAVVLHLGGDETPAEWVRHVLEAGTVICDDVHTVAHRNSQSVALYFSRMGQSLEDYANSYQILNFWEIFDDPVFVCRTPVLVTCVGMPVLDLYLAQHVYETANGITPSPV